MKVRFASLGEARAAALPEEVVRAEMQFAGGEKAFLEGPGTGAKGALFDIGFPEGGEGALGGEAVMIVVDGTGEEEVAWRLRWMEVGEVERGEGRGS